MEISKEKAIEYTRRLLQSRLRLLTTNGFYGLLLMHMKFGLDERCKTAYTDSKKICFSPEFMDSLSDSELDFVLMHEILHVVLQHCSRNGDRDPDIFNIACDIVVNSNILFSNNMNPASITLKKWGESMHLTPNGDEGYEYTAEQVYSMLNMSPKTSKDYIDGFDDHSKWNKDDDELEEEWEQYLREACAAMSARDEINGVGNIPLCAERMLKELKKSQIDWRTILNNFIQEEVNDYSFSPPDRRFDDCPFFLPDFNEKGEIVEDILFMIDTSGSMSDEMITYAYSEVKGAIDQFGGRLRGWLGFFDAEVIEPKPFENEDEFRIIAPKGGGGTNFHIIFEYVRKHMQDKLPASIIILTDGYAPFPKEEDAMGIPVLWLLNNEKVEPKWGKVARIEVEESL